MGDRTICVSNQAERYSGQVIVSTQRDMEVIKLDVCFFSIVICNALLHLETISTQERDGGEETVLE